MDLLARLIPGPALDERFAVRMPVQIEASLSAPPIQGCEVSLLDISTEGFLVDSIVPFAVEQQVQLELPLLNCSAATVRWRDGTRHGCRFDAPLAPGQVREIALRGGRKHQG